MRVMNPGPGEVMDRLSILYRKILEGGEKAKHLEDERDDLWAELGRWNQNAKMPSNIQGLTWMLLLSAVNGAIWERENMLRRLRDKEVEDDIVFSALAGTVAMKNQELNDKRNALIVEINSIYGIRREEKIQ